jgi:RND family efflux transporter MFP subunit
MLSQGSPVFELVDDTVLELRAAVPSSDYGKVLPGAAVTVTAEPNGRLTRQGRVARISPVVDEKSRSFEIVVEVARGEGLAAGMFAAATLHLPSIPGALLVPPQALSREAGDASRARVFVVEGGTARRRDVVLGLELPSAVEVKEGLSAGAIVILDPPMTLADGTAVSPQPDPSS